MAGHNNKISFSAGPYEPVGSNVYFICLYFQWPCSKNAYILKTIYLNKINFLFSNIIVCLKKIYLCKLLYFDVFKQIFTKNKKYLVLIKLNSFTLALSAIIAEPWIANFFHSLIRFYHIMAILQLLKQMSGLISFHAVDIDLQAGIWQISKRNWLLKHEVSSSGTRLNQISCSNKYLLRLFTYFKSQEIRLVWL